MASLTSQQRVEIIKVFYSNNCSIVTTIRKLRDFFWSVSCAFKTDYLQSYREFRKTPHTEYCA